MIAQTLNVMNYYLISNPLFCRGGQNGNFHFRFRAKLKGVKNGFRKMAASQCYFYGDIGSSVSKIC